MFHLKIYSEHRLRQHIFYSVFIYGLSLLCLTAVPVKTFHMRLQL